MHARSEEIRQPCAAFGDGVGACEADRIEAELACLIADTPLKRAGIAQKSRSA
jgi:hypothetical protein